MRKKANLLMYLLVFMGFSSIAQNKLYSAGEIQSKTEVQYGRMEFRMYSSNVSGTTSTFFMWKNGGEGPASRWNEIDIETFGKESNSWQSNPIWEYNAADGNTKRWEGKHYDFPIAKTWVIFALEWTPNYIAWFTNGKEVRRILKGQNAPQGTDPVGNIADPMRMCFNHWAAPGDWLGPFNDAQLPSFQFVDWFTYQKWNGTGFDPVSIRQDFTTVADITNNYNISTHTFDPNVCDFSTQNVGVVNGMLWLSITKKGASAPPAEAQIPDVGTVTPPLVYNHILPKKVEAEQFNNQFGLQTQATTDLGGGENLGYTDAGDYVEYAIETATAGNYLVDFRVASLNGGASFSVLVDNVVAIPSVAVNTTGGWQTWGTVTNELALSAGKHTLRINVLQAGFNLNWINFTKKPEAPVLSFSNITQGNVIVEGTDLNINVVATHSSGIANVQLFLNNTLVRQENLAPFDWGLGVNDPQLNTLAPGTYTLKAIATAINGEFAETSIAITISAVTGIIEDQIRDFDIYPNPVVNTIFLSKSIKWELLSSEGKLLLTGEGDSIPMESFEKGIYFVKTPTTVKSIIKQ